MDPGPGVEERTPCVRRWPRWQSGAEGHQTRPEKRMETRSSWALLSLGPLRAQSLPRSSSQASGKDKEAIRVQEDEGITGTAKGKRGVGAPTSGHESGWVPEHEHRRPGGRGAGDRGGDPRRKARGVQGHGAQDPDPLGQPEPLGVSGRQMTKHITGTGPRYLVFYGHYKTENRSE